MGSQQKISYLTHTTSAVQMYFSESKHMFDSLSRARLVGIEILINSRDLKAEKMT